MKFNNKLVPVLAVILSVLFLQCVKEDKVPVVGIDSIDELSIGFRWYAGDFSDLDGRILVETRQYINQEYSPNCDDYGAITLSGVFEENASIGDVIVAGNSLPVYVNNGSVRYLYDGAASELAQVATGIVDIELDAQVGAYASFSRSVPLPKPLCATTSLGASEVFPKSQDLVINWETDPDFDFVYIAICAAGVPCIFKEVPDTGSYTVSSSEFLNFPVGAFITMHLGRGYAEAVQLTNGKKIALLTVNYSRTASLSVGQ